MFILSRRPKSGQGEVPLERYRAFAFVDWDDTLVATNVLYNLANRENARDVLAALGEPAVVSEEEILTLADEIDLAKVRTIGLSHSRYPEAWAEAYQQLAEKWGRPLDPAIVKRVRERAEQVAWAPQEWLPGAQEALRVLRQAGAEISIWTAGEVEVQQHKLEHAFLSGQPVWQWVDQAVIVPDKDTAMLRQALGPRLTWPERCLVIGNSPRADVRPALELGMTAVWVQGDSWSYDRHPIGEDEPGLHRLASLTQFPAWFERWLQR